MGQALPLDPGKEPPFRDAELDMKSSPDSATSNDDDVTEVQIGKRMSKDDDGITTGALVRI